jgi:hypothetical protein
LIACRVTRLEHNHAHDPAARLGLFLFADHAVAQSWAPPADNQRCPSKWGATDERGSGNHMNLRLDELAARRAHEFALIVEPLKIQGGTGSTVAPIAIR